MKGLLIRKGKKREGKGEEKKEERRTLWCFEVKFGKNRERSVTYFPFLQ